MTAVVILGAGGHARVLVAAMALRGVVPIGCVAPERPAGEWPVTIAYLGSDDVLGTLDVRAYRLVNGRGSVASTYGRRWIFESARQRGFTFDSVVHPAAIVAGAVTLGEGAQLMAGAILQVGAVLGDNVIINTGAIVDHDCRIGAHSHVATGARLAGGVIVGDRRAHRCRCHGQAGHSHRAVGDCRRWGRRHPRCREWPDGCRLPGPRHRRRPSECLSDAPEDRHDPGYADGLGAGCG